MPVGVTPPVAIHQAMAAPARADGYREFVHRVWSEFLEMPGLSLTFTQACRLWAVDERACGHVLRDLVAEGFLAVSARGHYVRPPNT
jgi:hypothetical protein